MPTRSRIQVSPYVNFQGRAREAMEFYQQALGGDLVLQTVDERGEFRPAGPADPIRHARLETDGVLILASDGHPHYPPKVGDNMALALGGADRARLTRVFDHLADGGRIQMPLSRQPWGGDVGWLTDKFAVTWTVTIDPGERA